MPHRPPIAPNPDLRIMTIGAYGYDGDRFLQQLQRAQVRLLIDVRQRRGVRGAAYAWANARRLQHALLGAGIDYAHHSELAPTTELRQLQYAEDARTGVGKRSRQILAEGYRQRYQAEILDRADLTPVLTRLAKAGIAALFCVECHSAACHRSLVAQRLAEQTGATIVHLGPDDELGSG